MPCMPAMLSSDSSLNLPCWHCRNYQKAASALKAMRAGAIQHSRSASFNDTLKHLRTLFLSSQQHKNFWQLLMAQRITLISDEEGAGSGISAAEAADFLENPASHAQACSLLPLAFFWRHDLVPIDASNLPVRNASTAAQHDQDGSPKSLLHDLCRRMRSPLQWQWTLKQKTNLLTWTRLTIVTISCFRGSVQEMMCQQSHAPVPMESACLLPPSACDMKEDPSAG